MAIGTPVDVSDRPIAHDIRLISDPHRVGALQADKQRSRNNLMAVDFHDECGHLPGVHVTKATIARWLPIPDDATAKLVADQFLNPTYEALVIASFEDPTDAKLYRLSI